MRVELNENDWESLLMSPEAHKVNKCVDIFNCRTNPSKASCLDIVKKITENEGSTIMTLIKNGKKVEIVIIHDIFHSISNSFEDWSEDESEGKFYGLVGYPKNGKAADIVPLPLSILMTLTEEEMTSIKAPKMDAFFEISNEEAFLSDDLIANLEDLEVLHKSPSREALAYGNHCCAIIIVLMADVVFCFTYPVELLPKELEPF